MISGKAPDKEIYSRNRVDFRGHEELGARKMNEIFNRLKLPKDNLPYVEKLIRLHQRPMTLVDEGVTDSAVRRLAFQAGNALEDLFTLCRADITTKNPDLFAKYWNNYDIVTKKVIEVQEKDKLREFQSPVRGEEIMEICNIEPQELSAILKRQLKKLFSTALFLMNTKTAKKYFLENEDKWLEEYHKSGKKLFCSTQKIAVIL